MHDDYLNPAIRQLRDQQVRFAPREKKLEQAAAAEKLLSEIEPSRTYTYEYLCFRVTRYRPESYPDLKMTGKEAACDLRLLDRGSLGRGESPCPQCRRGSADGRRCEQEVPCLDEDGFALAAAGAGQSPLRLRRPEAGGVPRQLGATFRGSQPGAGSPRGPVQSTEHGGTVGNHRSARRLARAGGCPAEVTKRLSRHSGRSVETVRYTLKQFDHEHPEMAIFPDNTGPLREETRSKIYQQYRRGQSVDSLAKRFCRTKTSIYRIIAEMRAMRIMELPMDYIPNDGFARVRSEKQEREYLGPTPPSSVDLPKKTRLPSGLPPYLASLYQVPLLTREQEMHLFRKMNYLKYKACKLRDELDLSQPKSGVMDQIEKLYDESVAVKNEIISANLRLVVSIAKRHVGPVENFFELVSDGNVSLIAPWRSSTSLGVTSSVPTPVGRS